MIFKKFARGLFAGALICLAASGALAAPITTPVGLNPGDQYRLIFVTDAVRDGTSSDIADYNDFVTAVANSVTELAALATIWMAIASTATVDARDNTGTNTLTGLPIFQLNPASSKVADDDADLWDGVPDLALIYNENGAVPTTSSRIWTGTTGAGFKSPDALLGAASPRTGLVGALDSRWIAHIQQAGTEEFRFYALSAPLTVPTPAPAPIGLLVAGLAGIAVMHRGRLGCGGRKTSTVGA